MYSLTNNDGIQDLTNERFKSVVEYVYLQRGDTILFVENGEYDVSIEQTNKIYDQLKQAIQNNYMGLNSGSGYAYIPKGLRLVVVRNDY